MLVLAAVARAGAGTEQVCAALPARDQVVARHAISNARRVSALWLNLNGSEVAAKLGWFAVADAVAAQELHAEMPEVAASANRGWRAAREVRARLRELGPAAEQVALRLAPSWQAHLLDLPDAAEAVASRPCQD